MLRHDDAMILVFTCPSRTQDSAQELEQQQSRHESELADVQSQAQRWQEQLQDSLHLEQQRRCVCTHVPIFGPCCAGAMPCHLMLCHQVLSLQLAYALLTATLVAS